MVLRVKHGAMLDQLSLCCSPSQARWRGPDARTLSHSSTAYGNMGLYLISGLCHYFDKIIAVKQATLSWRKKIKLWFSEQQHRKCANSSLEFTQ